MGDSYYRTILDAMPLPVLVVDEDVRIRVLNRAGSAAFGLDEPAVLRRRGGEALHCLHAQDSPDGCGRGSFCRTCIVRNSVKAALDGKTVVRRRTKLELGSREAPKTIDVLITASPLPGKEPLALLVIEDISEISSLRDIIPICAKCKKIRDDHAYWQRVESYFHEHLGVDFTHGLCPVCVRELYPDVGQDGTTP